MTLHYLQQYSQFETVEQMDFDVKKHVEQSFHKITNATRKVLYAIAGRSLRYVGASHLKAETIAQGANVSVKTVMRAVKKLVELGVIDKMNRTKGKGIKGANIYSIRPFILSNVPSEMSELVNHEIPCESKAEGAGIETESINLLITSKTSLKDYTYQKEGAVASTSVLENGEKNISLRQKIAQQLKARNWSVTTLSEFATIAYGQIKTLLKQDATLPKEYLENLVYKKFLTVVDNKKSTNPFGLFSYLIKKEFAKLLGQAPADGEQCELELTAKQGGNFEVSPQWLIDQEQDPIKKARLIKQNEIATQKRKSNRGKEALPSWFVPLTEQTKEEPKETIELDIETEHKRIMQALGIDA